MFPPPPEEEEDEPGVAMAVGKTKEGSELPANPCEPSGGGEGVERERWVVSAKLVNRRSSVLGMVWAYRFGITGTVTMVGVESEYDTVSEFVISPSDSRGRLTR